MSCFSSQAATTTVVEPDPTKHVNYNLGMVLGVDDFNQEFAYLSGRDQWMVRDLIGYGTARGLRIGIEEDATKGPRVIVEPGVAVSPRGQMICVPSAQCAYLRDALESRVVELERHLGSTPASIVQLYVVLCYRDCPTDKVPIAGEPCRSEEELMAPSRLADDFCLELRFERPNQREENAVRDFIDWIKRIDITDDATSSTPLEQFLAAIRTAAGQWLLSPPSSPPSSPPDDFMFGSPPEFLHISRTDLCEYMRAAFRLWVTELRPKWIARWHGCATTHFDVDDQREEDCVLLAELTVPVVLSSPGAWTVADTPDVVINEARRPFVVHLRMIQEWMLCGPCCQAIAGGPSAPSEFAVRPTVELPAGLPPYQIVAAGIVGGAGFRVPVYNGLRGRRLDASTLILSFNGYTPPDNTFQYVVKAMAVSAEFPRPLVVTFVNFLAEGFVLRLTNTGSATGGTLDTVELMVEVSRFEAEREVTPVPIDA